MEKPANEKRDESTPQNNSTSTRDKEFDEAVERVYRKYGSDLSAFVRDFQRDVQKVHRSSESTGRVVGIDD